MRRLLALVPLAATLLVVAPTGHATGRPIVFDGGTASEHAQVTSALAVSSFDWDVLPPITVHIQTDSESSAIPGEIWLDARLLDAGRFSWGVVQHEFAHEVDFLVLTASQRSVLQKLLGAKTWCDVTRELPHSAYGCERFASTLAWSFWQSRDNCMRPESRRDESAAVSPAAFRSAIARIFPVERRLSAAG
jgi:hypothetical protein